MGAGRQLGSNHLYPGIRVIGWHGSVQKERPGSVAAPKPRPAGRMNNSSRRTLASFPGGVQGESLFPAEPPHPSVSRRTPSPREDVEKSLGAQKALRQRRKVAEVAKQTEGFCRTAFVPWRLCVRLFIFFLRPPEGREEAHPAG